MMFAEGGIAVGALHVGGKEGGVGGQHEVNYCRTSEVGGGSKSKTSGENREGEAVVAVGYSEGEECRGEEEGIAGT